MVTVIHTPRSQAYHVVRQELTPKREHRERIFLKFKRERIRPWVKTCHSNGTRKEAHRKEGLFSFTTFTGPSEGGGSRGSGEAFAVPPQKLFFCISASKGQSLGVFIGKMSFPGRGKAEMGHFQISYWVAVYQICRIIHPVNIVADQVYHSPQFS